MFQGGQESDRQVQTNLCIRGWPSKRSKLSSNMDQLKAEHGSSNENTWKGAQQEPFIPTAARSKMPGKEGKVHPDGGIGRQ